MFLFTKKNKLNINIYILSELRYVFSLLKHLETGKVYGKLSILRNIFIRNIFLCSV